MRKKIISYNTRIPKNKRVSSVRLKRLKFSILKNSLFWKKNGQTT